MTPSMGFYDCFDPLCRVRGGALSVILCVGLGTSSFQVLRTHANHDSLLFLCIKQLNNTIMNKIGPGVALFLRDLHNVILLDQEFAIIDYEERAAHSSRVGIDP